MADLIARGEGEELEFKASSRWDYRQSKHNTALESLIPKTVAGFLNGKGGTLLIGVDDRAKVVGLERDYATLGTRPNKDGYQQFLVSLLSSTIGKEIFSDVTIGFEETDGLDVCIMRVRPSLKPVYVKEKEGAHTVFYIRSGSTTQPLGLKEAMDYIRSRWKQ